MTDDDRDLRARFETLAAHDAAVTPALRIPAARTTPRAGRRTRYSIVWLAAAAAAAVVMITRAEPDPPPYSVDLGLVTWVGPTDVLLDVPGSEFLRGMPRMIDVPAPSGAVNARDNSNR